MGWTGFFSHHKVKDPRPSSVTRTCSVGVGLGLGRFESSSGGNVWRIHYQAFSRKSKIPCDRGLVLCHWQDDTGKGKISVFMQPNMCLHLKKTCLEKETNNFNNTPKLAANWQMMTGSNWDSAPWWNDKGGEDLGLTPQIWIKST